ncbi:hypothetical protein JCM17846_21780 [Iodidimonas nitroreducens]|uniref:Uncharacterized protein n=1 Tax=Iodidimonas nitroreducens TaxID=1236968 RepID=A0A5A7NC02_9PROT|nr:hypothetical protein [Iodidimonas nitroreducens]GER04496.1 hypothetical protein JCM17846_21780 [Iodidimonas nitroreducens]
MAAWDYEDLQKAVLKAVMPEGSPPLSSLYDLIDGETAIGEADFADAISRNLRLGRMLLLIVGDGVREGVESLSGYLQKHAGFHFTLGIIEMPIFHGAEDGFYIQPRILARTVNIERGIVRIIDGRVAMEAPQATQDLRASGRRTLISQDRMLEILEKAEPGLPAALQAFLDRAADQAVTLESASKSLQLRVRGPGDDLYALGGINEKGEWVSHNVNWYADSLGRIDLAHDYLEMIAGIIGGEVRKTPNPRNWYVVEKGTLNQPRAMALLAHPEAWLAAIEAYAERLMAACVDVD